MNKSLTLIALAATALLAGCGGGGAADAYVDVPPGPVAVQPVSGYLTRPTISGLEYYNNLGDTSSALTTAAGGYVAYSGGDTVTFTLGDIVLFTLPGDPAQPLTSLYDASSYSSSVLLSNTAVENLMAFLMAIDDDGNYTNGIQIAGPVRTAAHGLRVNFNQSAYDFRADPAVQYATSVLSGNTLFGERSLPSPSDAALALQVP